MAGERHGHGMLCVNRPSDPLDRQSYYLRQRDKFGRLFISLLNNLVNKLVCHALC